MRKFLSLLIVPLFCLPLLGSAQASKTKHDRGQTFRMCLAETDDGTCQNSDGEDIFAIAHRYNQFTFYFSETGTAGATCNIYAVDNVAHPSLPADLDTLTSLKINSTALSATADKISFDGTFYYIWVKCTLGTATNVTVSMQASEGRERQ
jgi:hypothetical protein